MMVARVRRTGEDPPLKLGQLHLDRGKLDAIVAYLADEELVAHHGRELGGNKPHTPSGQAARKFFALRTRLGIFGTPSEEGILYVLRAG